MKYFVKYREWTSRDTTVSKTRFFNADDIEQEWEVFKSFTANPLTLDDILPLPEPPNNTNREG